MYYVATGDCNPEEWPLKAGSYVPKFSPSGREALSAAASFCLKMEQRFMLVWKNQHVSVSNVELLSEKIQERACYLIHIGREFSELAAASLVCIANEAALAFELLTRGAKPTDEEIKLCNHIRQCALSLMFMEGPYSDASAAAMVGVAKEARKMCEWMGNVGQLYAFQSYSEIHKMGLCDAIRIATFGLFKHILSNFTEGKELFVIMNFGEVRSKSKSQKTMTGTQIEQELLHEGKNVLELNDNNRESNALMIDRQTDLVREQTKDLANYRKEWDNSGDERTQHLKPSLDTREYLSKKENQAGKVIYGKQSVEQVSSSQNQEVEMLTPVSGLCKPDLLDDSSLLDCIVRAVSASGDNETKISSTLPNRLQKMLAPLRWRDYKERCGKLHEFVAKHPELFVIEGDFIHLRRGRPQA